MGFFSGLGKTIKHAFTHSAPAEAAKGLYHTADELVHGHPKKALHEFNDGFKKTSNHLPLPNPVLGAENVIDGMRHGDGVKTMEGFGDFISPMISHTAAKASSAARDAADPDKHPPAPKHQMKRPAFRPSEGHPRKRPRVTHGFYSPGMFPGGSSDRGMTSRNMRMPSKVSGPPGRGYMMHAPGGHNKIHYMDIDDYANHPAPPIQQQQFRGQNPSISQPNNFMRDYYAQGPAPLYSDF